MNTRLGCQQAVGVIAFDAKRGRLYPRLASRLFVKDLSLETFPLSPSEIHPKQHLRKILCISSACAGLDRADRIVRVCLAGKQTLDLRRSHFAFKLRD